MFKLATTFQFLFILCAIGLSNVTFASVDLFDSKRNQPKSAQQQKAQTAKNQKQKDIHLTWVGASQLENITLYFRNKQKKQVSVTISPDKKATLPGYGDLLIEKLENRVLRIKDTKQRYCKNNKKNGITCKRGSGYIEMKIVRKHVVPPRPVKKKSKQPPAFGGGPKDKKKKGIKRIDPKDVPEGMKLIKSPFGDRIVPK